jgi:hypothetical protein
VKLTNVNFPFTVFQAWIFQVKLAHGLQKAISYTLYLLLKTGCYSWLPLPHIPARFPVASNVHPSYGMAH